jgi:DNA-binding transcriptional regulator GbsR (MarR family)
MPGKTVGMDLFVNRIAALLEPWGMAAAQGRVYGYILLQGGPVSLEQVADELGISKVSAWKAAKDLEAFGHIRKHGVAGSKLHLYGATDQFSTPLLKQGALLAALAELLTEGAAAASDSKAAKRLSQMSTLYRSVRNAIDDAVSQFERSRAAARKPSLKKVTGVRNARK